jgi:RNA polymerase sigma factor (sigma-70 family)
MAGTGEPNGNTGRSRQNGRASVQDARERVAAQERELRERPQELLRSLTSFVNFELGRRIRLGQMDHEDLLRDEVIDTAFASALTRLGEGEPIRDLHTYLRTRAQDMIGREVRRIQQERRQHVSLEQTIAAGEEAEGGEEVRIVDILPDPNAREPEQVVIDAESLAFMLDALSDVPDLWRTIFLQRTMQERSAREVADLEGLDIDEVRRITIRTRDYLRERFELEYDFFDDE